MTKLKLYFKERDLKGPLVNDWRPFVYNLEHKGYVTVPSIATHEEDGFITKVVRTNAEPEVVSKMLKKDGTKYEILEVKEG